MLKRCKVVMLPTNKPSKLGNLVTYQEHSLAKVTKEGVNPKNTTVQFWNLYIISDDEIKEGDWCYDLKNNCTLQAKSSYEGMRIKKIIATTDTSLKIDNPNYDIGRLAYINLPQPSQQFIEKYVEEYNKGNIITNVLVEYEEWCNCNGSIKMRKHLRTTKCDKCIEWDELKINPKDNTITIKKVKDSWNREEVIILLEKALAESKEQYSLLDRVGINKWIEENL